MDLGRDAEGRAALKEAVRRTPALASEVAARLGTAPSNVLTPLKEGNGYA
jgi:hypothetical protein